MRIQRLSCSCGAIEEKEIDEEGNFIEKPDMKVYTIKDKNGNKKLLSICKDCYMKIFLVVNEMLTLPDNKPKKGIKKRKSK